MTQNMCGAWEAVEQLGKLGMRQWKLLELLASTRVKSAAPEPSSPCARGCCWVCAQHRGISWGAGAPGSAGMFRVMLLRQERDVQGDVVQGDVAQAIEGCSG